jgi:general nucleoside transport system permease protein
MGPLRRLRQVAIGLLPASMAALGALGIGALVLLALKANPFEAYKALFQGAFGSVNALGETVSKAVPLLLVGIGICIAFRAGVFNIGGEGQIVAGALLSVAVALAVRGLPGPVIIPLVLIGGLVGGAVWGAIPGALKAYFNVNEILSTIMLNIVAVELMNYLLRGPLLDPVQRKALAPIPQTVRLSPHADLPVFVRRSQLNFGALVAVVAAIVVYLLLWKTTFGFRLRAVGLSRDASRFAGMPVRRSIVLALTLSGATAGMAGAILVFGSASHRLVTDGTATGFTGAAGYNGIVAALFGGLHPLWTIVSSFIFGGLLIGGNAVQIAVQVPTELVVALNGLLVVAVVSTEHVRRRLRLRAESRGEVSGPAPAMEVLVPEGTAEGREVGG